MTEPVPPLVLIDRCYLPHSSYPSSIMLPATNGNNYELTQQYITMLPELFVWNLKTHTCLLASSKRCAQWKRSRSWATTRSSCDLFLFHSGIMQTSGCTTWPQTPSPQVEFIIVFLKKFLPMHKMAKIRSKINQFHQIVGEPFFKYQDRFKDLLVQCHYHTIVKMMFLSNYLLGCKLPFQDHIESLSNRDFIRKTDWDERKFLKEMTEKTM